VVREPQAAGAYADSLRGSIAPQLNARSNDFELDSVARGAKFTGMAAGDIAATQAFGGASKTIGQHKMGTAGNTVDQVSAGAGKYDAGMENVIDISRGRAAGGFKGQIDRQQSSEYKDQSLRDGAEVIQRHQSSAESVIGDTGRSSSMRGENKEGWQVIENQNGVRYEHNERTPWAQVKNFNPQMTLSNKAELTKSAASSLQNDIRWNSVFTNADQFARDNRTSKEVAYSANKDIAKEISKRVSNDNSLSETAREEVRKDMNGVMQVGFSAGSQGNISANGHFTGGMVIGKSKTDGIQGGHTLTAQEAESLNKIVRASERNALQNSLSNADSKSWAKQLNESAGSAETKNISDMASRSVSLTENQSQNITGEMVDYLKQKNNVSADKAMEMMNKGYEGRDADTAFVASEVLMGENVARSADQKIERTENELENSINKDRTEGESLRQDVDKYTDRVDLKDVTLDDKPKATGINEKDMDKKIADVKGKKQAAKDKMTPYPQPIVDAAETTKNKLKEWISDPSMDVYGQGSKEEDGNKK
jgi:hypothetical protein